MSKINKLKVSKDEEAYMVVESQEAGIEFEVQDGPLASNEVQLL